MIPACGHVLGIDIGSTTVKTVVVDTQSREILWSDYRRHETRVGLPGLDGGAEGIRTGDLRSAGASCGLDGSAASGSARLNAADSAPLDRTSLGGPGPKRVASRQSTRYRSLAMWRLDSSPSPLEPSARRIERLMLTRRCGCAGGCASSTKSGGEGAGAIHSRTSTGILGSYA